MANRRGNTDTNTNRGVWGQIAEWYRASICTLSGQEVRGSNLTVTKIFPLFFNSDHAFGYFLERGLL